MPIIQRAAVIGGGPIGIETAKCLIAESCFAHIDIFEQQAQVGGAWLHTDPSSKQYSLIPQTNPFQPLQEPHWEGSERERRPVFMTPMYDKLETNIPKELMEFTDLPFPSSLQLFPSRQDVLAYTERHALDVRHLIRFGTQVTKVELLEDDADKWRLTSRDLQSQRDTIRDYDAIAVCTGHYVVPYVPPILGIDRWSVSYPDTVSHSKWYRSPDQYTSRKVLVVGNGASGIDIAKQIAATSQSPLLTSQRSPSIFVSPGSTNKDSRIKSLPEIAEFIDPDIETRAVRFVDGHIERNIDAILFATGYLYSFPFLPYKQLDLLGDGTRVQHTYQHVFHMLHPTLAFLALPVKILPFPVGEAQAAVVARIWSGRLKLPPLPEMRDWEDARIKERGGGKAFHSLNFPQDFEYQRFMHDWAKQADPSLGKLSRPFEDRAAFARERFASIREAFANLGPRRRSVRTIEELGFNYEQWLAEQASMSNGSQQP